MSKEKEFTRYIHEYKTKKRTYEDQKEKNIKKKTPIPWEDDPLDKEGFIGVSCYGTKVAFKLQEGSYNDNGYSGIYPVVLIQFAHQIYKSFEVKDGETSEIITDLENALLYDLARTTRRDIEGTHGSGNEKK